MRIHGNTNRISPILGRCIVLLAMLIVSLCNPAVAQPAHQEVGVIAAFDYGIHAASIRGISGVPSCCPEYGTTAGTGYLVGLEYNRQLSGDFSVASRLLVSGMTVDFVTDETVLLSINGNPVNGTFEHTLAISLTTIAIEPAATYRILPNLFVFAGFNAAFPARAAYEQKETIVDPAYGIFLDTGTNVRNRISRDVPNTTGAFFSGVGGIRMRIPLSRNGSHALYPEISYRHALNNAVDGMSWKPHSMRAGIVLTMEF